MNTLLARLLSFLFPGVDDPGVDDPSGDAGGDPGADTAGGDPGADDPNGDELDIDFVEEPEPRTRGASSVDDRVRALEQEVERRGRMVEESRRSSPASTPTVDAEFQREEERLRSADCSEQERWQITANRTLRDTRRDSMNALLHAADVHDRTLYESKVQSDPRREKYRARVEAAVQEERRQGRNASRESVYFFMLGKDIAEGKLKPKVKAKTPAAEVPRGRSLGARSDVPARRGATEHQKRAARLENINI